MERLPLEQQEPIGPALQRCNGGFQESNFQRDYLQLEGLCLHLEDTESPQGGEAYICVPNIDKTAALKTLPPPLVLGVPVLHPSTNVSGAQQEMAPPTHQGPQTAFCQQQGTA